MQTYTTFRRTLLGDIMRLIDEIRAQIQAFIDDSLTARELEGWLDSVVDESHAEKSGESRRLAGQAYALLAELSYGDRSMQEVKAELLQLLRESNTGTVTMTVERTIDGRRSIVGVATYATITFPAGDLLEIGTSADTAHGAPLALTAS